MFHSLTPVMSGFGMRMLMKMGWELGQPLGKSGQGHIAPIPVDVKTDRQGRYYENIIMKESRPLTFRFVY